MSKSFLKIRWPFIIFAVAVLLATQIMVTLNYFYHARLQQVENAVGRTERALYQQHDFLQIFQKLILAQRSFVLTNDEQFLTLYNNLKEQSQTMLDHVIALSRAGDKESTHNLHEKYTALIRFMDESIALRQKNGAYIPSANNRVQDSFQHMSDFDQSLTHYITIERKHLHNFKILQQRRQSTYNQSILAAAILSTFFLGALGYLLLKQQQRENQTQTNLKETKERLDLAITGSNDGVWDWNIINNQIFFSDRWKDIVGYKNNEMPNAIKAFDILLHPDDRTYLWDSFDQYLAKKISTFDCTFRMRHKDGSWRWVMSRGQALWRDDGTAYRMIGVHTDMTSIKQMEKKLQTSRETAELANQTKTDFISHISHEIRTPLNAIIGVSRLLAQAKPLSEAYREHVNVLHTGSQNLQFLINDLLDLSKLDQGSLTLELRDFNLHDMVAENVELYRYHAASKDLNLTFENHLDAQQFYQGDSLRLAQILNNLLANAVKFTDSGSVSVSLYQTPDPSYPNTDIITITVEDTGIGIPHDQLDNIFHKFTQSDQSISRRYGGSGLGLSICKELCDLMHGTITVHSIVDQGSEFTVKIPLTRSNPTTETHDSSTEDTSNVISPVFRPRVLLVEDYQPNIFVAEALLESIGYDCDSVETGEEALKILNSEQRQKYSMALLDLELPDMSGYMIAEETRQYESQHALPALPLVAMTAHTSKSHQDRRIVSGMNDYMIKPIDLSALEKMLYLYATHHTPPSKKKTKAA
jgi:PAS domain S-box-containing protein